MKFNELTKKAKNKACKDYIKGWLETHPKEKISMKKAAELCTDINSNVEYNRNGGTIS